MASQITTHCTTLSSPLFFFGNNNMYSMLHAPGCSGTGSFCVSKRRATCPTVKPRTFLLKCRAAGKGYAGMCSSSLLLILVFLFFSIRFLLWESLGFWCNWHGGDCLCVVCGMASSFKARRWLCVCPGRLKLLCAAGIGTRKS
jgi:hypothetical protein